MIDIELQQKKEIIFKLGIYYSRQLVDSVIVMMAEDLADISLAELQVAASKYRADPKNRVFPLPAQLIAIARPDNLVSTLDIANETASKIIKAISKFGNPNFRQAQEYIGPFGWSVVQRYGGWDSICKLDEDQRNMFFAQLRGLCDSYQRIDAAEQSKEKLEYNSENVAKVGALLQKAFPSRDELPPTQSAE